jgi:hypothetical protein
MLKSQTIVLLIITLLGIFALLTTHQTAAAQKVDRSVPRQQQTLAIGEDDVKQLLLLMDTDKNGKISKKEFMEYMSAEFDRLDRDKNGELDPKELAYSSIRPSRPAVGK